MVNENRPKIRDYNYDPNHQHKPIETIRDFKNYEMFIIKKGTKKPLPIVYGAVNWTDNRESLGMKLTTSIPRNTKDRFFKYYDVVEIGDTIIFKNKNQVIFSGMIEEMTLNRYSKDIICYDSGFLLNKTNTLKQFSKIKGHDAIKKLCSDNGIPVGKVVNMGVSITEIYKNTAISDIIKDIMSKEENRTGNKMTMEIRSDKLYIDFVKNLKIEMIYKPAANVSLFDPRKTIGEINRNDSITDIKNEVKVVYEEKKKTRIVATAKDNDSIKKYGRRTHIETITKDQLKQAKQIANNKLRELNGIKTNLTVELLGDDKVRAGRLVNLQNKTFKVKGDYIIDNCEQTYENNNRRMVLDLVGV